MSDTLNQFDGRRYISLETYRRDGTLVRTVWFVKHNGELIFYIDDCFVRDNGSVHWPGATDNVTAITPIAR